MVRCVAHMRRRSVYLWVSSMQARFWILRSFVRVMFLLISRAISIGVPNSSVLISSLRAHARFIDLVIDSIIDLAQLLPNYCKAQTNY